MLTKSDFGLVFSVIILIIGIYFLLNLTQNTGKFVIIEANGEEGKKIDLSENKVFDIYGKDGKMKIEISGSKVRVLNASCPKQICVKFGWIDKSGESIICLPNLVIIKILGDEEELDGTTR